MRLAAGAPVFVADTMSELKEKRTARACLSCMLSCSTGSIDAMKVC
jgi:hypothetical protein